MSIVPEGSTDFCTEALRGFSAGLYILYSIAIHFMNRDSLKEIIRQTEWINAFDEGFELQVSKCGVLFALFAVNVDEESNWKNIPIAHLKGGCIDFCVNHRWHDYQFIDESIDLDTATLCRWIIQVLRTVD